VATAGDRVIVKVLDRGPGMTEHEQARIFDRFYRGAGGGGVDGSGLGLAIVKHAVERAKGKLIVLSQPGAGATFEIDLPRAS
jgi:two-component system, OmpR family, sensor histidine kinase SenX3